MVMDKQNKKMILSASRRTDIPAFYMKWFMERLEKGVFETINPFNRQRSQILASPETIHSIVFWSKNFKPIISEGYGIKLRDMGYGLFFNFTVNSENPLLEPNIPRLEERLDQMRVLSDLFGPETIYWRFDPICFYRKKNGRLLNNYHDFETIAKTVAQCGINRCVTSFMDDYKKIKQRLPVKNGLRFIFPDTHEKANILLDMERFLSDLGISLVTCCEKNVMDHLPETSSISSGACIPGNRLKALYGGNISMKKDTGQRTKAGCRCRESKDIGSYAHHPCFHNCLFCYANPACDMKYPKKVPVHGVEMLDML